MKFSAVRGADAGLRLAEIAGLNWGDVDFERRRLTIHSLRHSAGTRLYEATRDIQVIARHLRHAQVQTASIYAHLADKDYHAAVDKLEGFAGA